MVGLYKGKSAMSRAIAWFTWSDYSHASWVEPDDRVFEAWKSGVGWRDHYAEDHERDTQIDLFDVRLSSDGYARMMRFFAEQEGKKYDFRGACGFVTRRDGANVQDRWFCSEIIFTGLTIAGVPPLHRVAAHRVSPGLLSYSPLLLPLRSVSTTPGPAADPADDITEFDIPMGAHLAPERG